MALKDISLDQIQKVSETVEVSTTRRTRRVRKKKATIKKLPKNYNQKVKSKIKKNERDSCK